MSGNKNSGGHNRLPTAVKAGRGTLRKSRTNHTEPVRIERRPVPTYPLDEIGEAFWQVWEPGLWANGTLSETDSTALTLLCYTASEWVKAANKCTKCGRWETVYDKNGEPSGSVEAAWSKLEMKLFDRFTKLLRAFGMDPVSRSTIHAISRGEKAIAVEVVT